MRRNNDSIAKQALQWSPPRLQKKRTTKEQLDKIHGERNVVSRFHIEMNENGGGNIRWSSIKTSSLWPLLH